MEEQEYNIAAHITLFGAWLTQRNKVSGPFSAKHDSAQMAELVGEFLEMKGLGRPNFDEVNGQHEGLRYKTHAEIKEREMIEYHIRPMTIEQLKKHYAKGIEDPPILDPNESPLKELRKEHKENRQEAVNKYYGTGI